MDKPITILLAINIAFYIITPIILKIQNKYYQGENTILDLIKVIIVFSIPIFNIFCLFIVIYQCLKETDFWNKKL